MSTNTIIASVVVIVIVIIGGFFLLQGTSQEVETGTQSDAVTEEEDGTEERMEEDMKETSEDEKMEEGSLSEPADTSTEGASDEESVSSEMPVPGNEDEVEEMIVNTDILVTYTNDGYRPGTVTVSAGERVTFVNESSRSTWPASNIHPTHTLYPNSSRSKCGTAKAEGIFDACEGISPGSSWSFTFTEVGAWGFHDHLRANHKGTVTVE